MRVLILEDTQERIEQFKVTLAKHECVFTDDIHEAANLLYTETWGVLFLDHDLGGLIMQESDSKTGYAVARWLEENPEYQPPIIVIHSLNPTGSTKMSLALPKAHVLPAAWCMPLERYGL